VSNLLARMYESVTDTHEADEILVACEGLPALFSFTIGTGAMAGHPIALEGNPLDVAFVPTSQNSWTAIVSIDNVHKPGSTTEIRDDQVSQQSYCIQRDGCFAHWASPISSSV
jgi:tRNA (guanine-N(7)-)-methyltransferase subunit TRM82